MSERPTDPTPSSTPASGAEPPPPGGTGGPRDSGTDTSKDTSKGAGGTKDGASGSSKGGTKTAPAPAADPLRGSRTSGVWVALAALVVVLVLLAIFVSQNTRSVEVTFLTWSGQAPLAAALLIATASGMLLAVAAGSLRILQLRRRVKREVKR